MLPLLAHRVHLTHLITHRHRHASYEKSVRTSLSEAQDLHHQVQALRALRGYRRLQAFKHRIEMIMIENMEQEAANGPSDFSASTIRRRIEAGYRDTELALQKHGLALEPGAGHTAA